VRNVIDDRRRAHCDTAMSTPALDRRDADIEHSAVVTLLEDAAGRLDTDRMGDAA
jgi:hypothetical protein